LNIRLFWYPVHPYNQEASSLQNKIENTAEFVEPTRDADEAITYPNLQSILIHATVSIRELLLMMVDNVLKLYCTMHAQLQFNSSLGLKIFS